MPIPKLPAWVASQIGLGVANALVLGYRSYERVQYMVKSRLKMLKSAAAAYTTRPRSEEQPAQSIESERDGPRIRIRTDSEAGSAHGSTSTDESPLSSSTSSLTGTENNQSTASPLYQGHGRPSKDEIASNVRALIETPGVALYFLRPEANTDRRVIHIYNNQGEKVYVLLRPDVRSQTWTLAYADTQMGVGDLATIYAGKKDGVGVGTGIISARAQPGKYILFNNPNGGLTYRKVTKQWTPEDGSMRTFYLAGAAPYHWTKAGFLQKSVFRNAEFFLTDPSVGSPAAIPLTVGTSSAAVTPAWSSSSSLNSSPSYFPIDGRARVLQPQNASAANRIGSTTSLSSSSNQSTRPMVPHTLWDLRPGSTGPQVNVVDRSLISKHGERETIAHAAKIARGMTWRIAVDTRKVSPEIVIATAWISILHQWSNKITARGVQLPAGVE
ncbi:hypothetical protein V1525DRAFT_402261 [Lipomyces kononenkoae]|uniref:Uncharacterized protein n=1 Tax=Lipomyces kononenkoae TaxID=34357 RepID=A0ACC3T287_LIPKO